MSDTTMATEFMNHDLDAKKSFQQILYEPRPVLDSKGQPVPDLHSVWITLNNERQLNSYRTETLKEMITGLRRASNDRSAVAVVLTAAGTRAFCTGGNTEEYSEYYAGRPLEYRQYMRLFNDMVTTLLHVDKPVINRVNGMRIAGGQEMGMACDITIAADTARFGQAGPRHGSAPDGGSTDFLHLFVGIGHAMESCTLCEHWSAHTALRLGLVNEIVPSLRHHGKWIANPLVITDRWIDELGRIVYGRFREGEEASAAKKLFQECTIDLTLLDQAVDHWCTKFLYTFPECLIKTIESMRKKKLEHWDRNRESNRAWLALNMMTEAKAGFRAFHRGPKEQREVDFVALRRRLACGETWDEAMFEAILPKEASRP